MYWNIDTFWVSHPLRAGGGGGGRFGVIAYNWIFKYLIIYFYMYTHTHKSTYMHDSHSSVSISPFLVVEGVEWLGRGWGYSPPPPPPPQFCVVCVCVVWFGFFLDIPDFMGYILSTCGWWRRKLHFVWNSQVLVEILSSWSMGLTDFEYWLSKVLWFKWINLQVVDQSFLSSRQASY